MVGMPEFVALANADDSVSANYSVSTSAVAEKDGNGFLTGKVTLTYSLTNTTAQAYIANPQFILKNSSWDSASVTLQNLYDGRSVTRNVAASPDNSISFTTQPLGTLLASQKPFYQYQLVAPGSTFTVVMRGVSVSDATKMYFQQNPGRSASALPSSAQTDSAISASWDGIYSRVQAEFTRTSANASMAGVAWVLGNSASDAVDIQKATMAAFGSLLDTSNDESSSSAWSQSKAALLNSATATIDNTSFDEATKEQYRQDAQNASDATGVSSVANLAKGRDDAIHSLDTLTGLSEADKESLKQRILNEPDWTKIQDILDEAVAQSGMSIEDQRAAALQTLGTYTDLPAADRTTATTAINAATTPAAIRTALSAAASANNKAVSNARTSALNSVYALVNLDLPTVLGYVNSINAATTVAEINTQSRAASTADKAVLSAAQNQATTTIQALPLPDARRRYYLGQVTSASKVSLVNEVLANAQAESETSLDGIKYSATATINALANLDTDTKSNYTTQVDNATSVADVKSILSQAKIENSNKLETRRAEVQTAVSKLKLNSTRQDAYANSISQADSVATLNLLLAQAQAEASNDLSSYRTQALAIVTALANLDSTALNSWVSQINAATDMTKISDLKLAAIAADTQALETARSNAYSALGVLVNNTDGDTKNYQSMVYTLTTKKDISALVDTATAKANERLKAARAAAEKSLEGLTYIDTSSYSDAIEDATMIKDVEAKVAAAVAANLDEAKKSATSTISGLGFIDTANYLSQVSVATTTTAVEQVTNNATAANTAAR
ncbi:MAG: GA module-containing protein, partial [Corynebacterium sp.]|nr:GA module-containing protein [Corynebacterium sp.]